MPTYEETGVSYTDMDPFKVAAQRAALTTAENLTEYFGYKEVSESRGESAYVWDEGDRYGAVVTEELGTKNLVADSVREYTGRSHYDQIAQCSVAMIVNDLVVVGAKPKVVTAHFAVGSSEWFHDQERTQDLVRGWAGAVSLARATWGGGETGTLRGVVVPGTVEISGTAVGEVKPKEELTLGDKLAPGDKIILLRSSGMV